MNIIHYLNNYFKIDSKDFNIIIKNINYNYDNIKLISNKIKKFINKEEIMISQIKINHLNMINKKLIFEINKIKRKILLRKFKNIIKIFNEILYKHLVNKNRDINEELIFLYTLSLENNFIEPNICDDVLNQLINKLIKLLNNLNIQIKYYTIKYN